MKLLSGVIVFELLATVVAFILYGNLKKGKLKTLPFFLLFISLVEIYGRYLSRIKSETNAWLYNLSVPLEYLYYFYLIGIHGDKFTRLFARTSSIVVICFALYCYYSYPFFEFNYILLLTGQIGTITLLLVYLIDFIRTDNELQIKQYSYFVWIAGGLLIFNLGDMVYIYLIPVTNRLKWDEFGLVFTAINNKLNYGLYACYLIATLIHWKKN